MGINKEKGRSKWKMCNMFAHENKIFSNCRIGIIINASKASLHI